MQVPSAKVHDVVQFFRNELSSRYDREEIEKFMEYCFDEFAGYSKADILLKAESTVTPGQLMKFRLAVKDLKRGRPIQFILGKAWFYGMEFAVSPAVLIPRPETEELVKQVIDNARRHSESLSILDIGTGSGCIAIALKKNLPRCHVYALDVSAEALEVAKQNAAKHNCEVHFITADILGEKVEDKLPSCSVIVSNPPYVKKSEQGEMHKNVLDYEPHEALFVPDEDALVFYRAIARAGRKKLKPGGMIYAEINETLGPETCILFRQEGYTDVQLLKDLQGKDRFVVATHQAHPVT